MRLSAKRLLKRISGLSALHKFILLAVGATFLVIGPVVIYDAVTAPLEFDGSYNLQTAQNVANGQGYASNSPMSYEDKIVFDPFMTTGPVAIFPIAFLINVFGDGTLAFRAFTGLVFAITAFISAMFVYKITKSRWAIAVIPAFLLLRFIDRSLPVDIAPVGEFAAAACGVGAFVAYAYKRPYLLGLLLTSAFLTKSIMFFLFISVLPIAVYEIVKLRRFIFWIKCMGAAFVSFVLWELYKLFSLGGFQAYVTNWREYIDFFTKAGSGLYGGPTSQGIYPKIEALLTGLSSPRIIVMVLIVAALAGLGYILLKNIGSAKRSARLLIWPLIFVALYCVWWLFLADRAYVRHIVPLLVVAFSLMCSIAILCLGKYHKPVLSFFVLIIVTGVGISVLRPIETQKLDDQKAVTAQVKRLPPDSLVHDGWWQNPEILYLANTRSADYRVAGTKDKYLLLSPTMKQIDSNAYGTNRLMCKEDIFVKNGYVLCALDK